MSEIVVPESVSGQLTAEVAHEIAAVYEDTVVYPYQTIVDQPGDPRRLFPGWPTPVLLISIENQGACRWDVPLDAPDPVVLVTNHDYVAGVWQPTTIVHTPNIAHYIATRRWDQRLQSQDVQLWADEASPLDDMSLNYLRAHFEQVLQTPGYPARANYRFHNDASMVMVLSSSGPTCEWRIGSSDVDALQRLATDLFALSNLRHALWASDPVGEALLERLRTT